MNEMLIVNIKVGKINERLIFATSHHFSNENMLIIIIHLFNYKKPNTIVKKNCDTQHSIDELVGDYQQAYRYTLSCEPISSKIIS